MQEDLRELTRALRNESCPRRVIDGALRRIEAERPQPGWLPYAITGALAALVFVCGLLVWSRLEGGKAGRQREMAEQQAHARKQAARQAETALGIIGTVLLDAGAHSETVISDRAIPPLRNGLETAKNKIIRHTEL